MSYTIADIDATLTKLRQRRDSLLSRDEKRLALDGELEGEFWSLEEIETQIERYERLRAKLTRGSRRALGKFGR